MNRLTLSHGHACNSIKLLYAHAGFKKLNNPLGLSVGKEFQKDVTHCELASLFAFIDEQIALLRLVSFYFLSAIAAKEARATIFYRVCVRQLKTLAAIRLNCTYGLDVAARLQLRSLYENSVLWARLQFDEQAGLDFEAATTPEQANKFWHKYLAKSKSETYLENEIRKTGRSWMAGTNSLIDELRQKLGPASHPSFLASYFEALDDWSKTEKNVALTDPVGGSHFTLTYSIFSAAIPFSIKPDVAYGFKCADALQDVSKYSPLEHASVTGNDYWLKISDMIPTILIMAVRFSEGLLSSDNAKLETRS